MQSVYGTEDAAYLVLWTQMLSGVYRWVSAVKYLVFGYMIMQEGLSWEQITHPANLPLFAISEKIHWNLPTKLG